MNLTLEQPPAGGLASLPSEVRQWLQDFRSELAGCNVQRDDATEAFAFYEEAFADRLEAGVDVARALDELGSPSEAAKRIAADAPVLERARRGWPAWLFHSVVALVLATAIIWAPLLLSLFVVLACLVGAFVLVDGALVAVFPMALVVFVRAVGAGAPLPTASFQLAAGIAIAGVGLLVAPVAVRAVELAIHAFWRGFEGLVKVVRRMPVAERGPWYGQARTLHTFDRVCLVGGGALCLVGAVVAVAILGFHGWSLQGLPGVTNVNELFNWGPNGGTYGINIGQ